MQTNNIEGAIDTITDVIADKVAEKIQQQQTSSSDSIQNGFDSINIEANKMASSGGGNKRKTRKFKLTKKHKTRQNRN